MSQQKSNENTDPTLMKEQNKLPKCDEESVQKLFAKQEHQIKFLKSRLNKVVKEKRRLVSEKHSTYKAILLTLFTEDQINHLIKQQRAEGKSKVTKWSNTTVKKALRLKFACGTAGYEELLKQGFPFPSRRTLTRKIEHIKFKPGISDEMLKYLEYKVANFKNDRDRECSIALDEISILGGKMFDPQTKENIGEITLPPNAQGTVKHGLVYVLTGIHAR